MISKFLFFIVMTGSLFLLQSDLSINCERKEAQLLPQNLPQNDSLSAGIIYGENGAILLEPPPGWILDNEVGASMGLPCVFYVKGFNWNDSPVIMYSKISAGNDESLDQFIDFTVDGFKKEDPNFIVEENDQKIAFDPQVEYRVMEYIGGPYKSYERVVYVKMPKGLSYHVFSARNKADFGLYADAVFDLMESYQFLSSDVEIKK